MLWAQTSYDLVDIKNSNVWRPDICWKDKNTCILPREVELYLNPLHNKLFIVLGKQQ